MIRPFQTFLPFLLMAFLRLKYYFGQSEFFFQLRATLAKELNHQIGNLILVYNTADLEKLAHAHYALLIDLSSFSSWSTMYINEKCGKIYSLPISCCIHIYSSFFCYFSFLLLRSFLKRSINFFTHRCKIVPSAFFSNVIPFVPASIIISAATTLMPFKRFFFSKVLISSCSPVS